MGLFPIFHLFCVKLSLANIVDCFLLSMSYTFSLMLTFSYAPTRCLCVNYITAIVRNTYVSSTCLLVLRTNTHFCTLVIRVIKPFCSFLLSLSISFHSFFCISRIASFFLLRTKNETLMLLYNSLAMGRFQGVKRKTVEEDILILFSNKHITLSLFALTFGSVFASLFLSIFHTHTLFVLLLALHLSPSSLWLFIRFCTFAHKLTQFTLSPLNSKAFSSGIILSKLLLLK